MGPHFHVKPQQGTGLDRIQSEAVVYRGPKGPWPSLFTEVHSDLGINSVNKSSRIGMGKEAEKILVVFHDNIPLRLHKIPDQIL